jgi:hypothetical protein
MQGAKKDACTWHSATFWAPTHVNPPFAPSCICLGPTSLAPNKSLLLPQLISHVQTKPYKEILEKDAPPAHPILLYAPPFINLDSHRSSWTICRIIFVSGTHPSVMVDGCLISTSFIGQKPQYCSTWLFSYGPFLLKKQKAKALSLLDWWKV